LWPAQSRTGEVSYGANTSPGKEPAEAAHQDVHPVTAVPLDENLSQHDEVRCLKIDAEGSEFPILLTSSVLHRVQEIVGELHACPPNRACFIRHSAATDRNEFRIEHLAAHLRDLGFFVVWRHSQPGLGAFFSLNERSAFRQLKLVLAFYLAGRQMQTAERSQPT